MEAKGNKEEGMSKYAICPFSPHYQYIYATLPQFESRKILSQVCSDTIPM